MRLVLVILLIAGLIALVITSLLAQARQAEEIERLRIQIRDMQKPVPTPLLDAKNPSHQKLEKSSAPLNPAYL